MITRDMGANRRRSRGRAAAGESQPSTPPPASVEKRSAAALAALFLGMALLAGLDLAGDLREGITPGHALAEGGIVAIGLAGLAWMLRRLARLTAEARELGAVVGELAADLDASRIEAARWREEAGDLITGLGAAIDRQLERWELTSAEQEVSLLLLKGLSHKEIGAIRGTGEATVRQQSRAIYRKAGLAGRHDLAAFFLEDLLDRDARLAAPHRLTERSREDRSDPVAVPTPRNPRG